MAITTAVCSSYKQEIMQGIHLAAASLHCRGRARARLSGTRLSVAKPRRIQVQAGSGARLRPVKVSIYKVNRVAVKAVINPSEEELAVLTEIL